VDDRRALHRTLKKVGGDTAALAAEAEVWADQVPERAGAAIELLQCDLLTRRARSRLSRHLALMCAERLAEASSRGDPEALRALAQLFPAIGRLACLRCGMATQIWQLPITPRAWLGRSRAARPWGSGGSVNACTRRKTLPH